LTPLYKTRYFIYKYFPKADQNHPYVLAGSRSSVKLILRVISHIPKDGIKYQNDTLNDIESNLTVKNNRIKKSLKIPKGNQKPYVEEEQTTQWPKENVQRDKQRSTKHTYRTKNRVKRTQQKTGGELRCSGRVSSSCSTSGTRRVNLVTNPVISRERGMDREVFTTSIFC
jgi:hypothetical protein